MRKYHKENVCRFDVEKIKPEFSMVTCTPLLNGRKSNLPSKDSPMVFSNNASRSPSPLRFAKSPKIQPTTAPVAKKPIEIRDIMQRFREFAKNNPTTPTEEKKTVTVTPEDDAADFDENDINEEDSRVSSRLVNTRILHKAFISKPLMHRKIPNTPPYNKRSFANAKELPTTTPKLIQRSSVRSTKEALLSASYALPKDKKEQKDSKSKPKTLFATPAATKIMQIPDISSSNLSDSSRGKFETARSHIEPNPPLNKDEESKGTPTFDKDERKGQVPFKEGPVLLSPCASKGLSDPTKIEQHKKTADVVRCKLITEVQYCLLYTSPSPRDATLSRMPSSA
eukprot:TRINITY_DN13360_c0_g1_i1.p1 TRINITY_DN13360_c0_g1~~TRINITY_DN13360_c0_g1_i1.p1  ORF type:complete len:339 (+),score=62.70 TRINITY_DN13360_c0_g1_i1:3-1019(+)